MARIFTEGFEMGDALFFTVNAGSVSAAMARSGTYSFLQILGNASYRALPSALSEGYVRVAVNYNGNTIQDILGNYYNVAFRSSTTNLLQVVISGVTTLDWWLGGVKQTQVNLPFSIDMYTWYLLEVHYKLSDTVGNVQVKIDGVSVLNFSGNTKPDANTTFNRIYFGTVHASPPYFIDDLAFNDTTGDVDNSWCGDGRIVPLIPNGNGDVNQFTGSDGNSTDNYLLVDETPSNGDTDYVETTVSGYQDMYNMSDFDASGNKVINRVWAEARGRNTVADGGQVKIGIVTHSGIYLSDPSTLLASYSQSIEGVMYRSNPNTGQAWTDAELDAIQFVVEAE